MRRLFTNHISASLQTYRPRLDHVSSGNSIAGILSHTTFPRTNASPVLSYSSSFCFELKAWPTLSPSLCVSCNQQCSQVAHCRLEQISAFVHHLRRIYRLENSYHNFEHALDVLQATYSYLRSANMVPSVNILFHADRKWKSNKEFDDGSLATTLRQEEIFVLFIAAIGHDVGHPGFTNYFMVNKI